MKWQVVSRDLARRHPLYGFGGWLAFWSVMTIVGLPISIVICCSRLSVGHLVEFQALDRVVPWVSQVNDALVYINMGTLVTFTVLWFFRIRQFRQLWTTVCIGLCTISLAYLSVLGLCIDAARPGQLASFLSAAMPDAVGAIIGYTVVLTPLLLYMFNSRRFRVTFEHKIETTDAFIATMVIDRKLSLSEDPGFAEVV